MLRPRRGTQHGSHSAQSRNSSAIKCLHSKLKDLSSLSSRAPISLLLPVKSLPENGIPYIVYFLLAAWLGLVASAPVTETGRGHRPVSIAAPHFVVYSDKFINGVVPPVDQVKGYNVL